MTTPLAELFSFYRFPNGRRAYALEGIARVAGQMGHSDLADAARRDFEWELETTAQLRQWSLDKKTNEGVREDAVALDQKIDRTVSALSSQLDSLASAFQDEELGKLAQRTQRQLLPGGVASLVLLNYEEQLAKCRDLANAFRALPSDQFASLGVAPFVERLEVLLPQFKQALDGASKREINYSDIQARQAMGQERMLSLVVRCLSLYPEATAEHAAQRAQLLAPLLDQQRRLKESFSRRSGQTDINPETGEEVVPAA